MAVRFFPCLTLAAALVACGGGGGGEGGDGGDDGDAADNDGNPLPTDAPPSDGIIVGGDGGNWECQVTMCNGRVTACGDCMDNDGDGEVDSHDRECLGPCDNTEGPALESGVGGVGGNSCGVDCYFDFGNGAGNDECVWDHRCDPNAPEAPTCNYDSGLVGGNQCPATQDPTCAEVCGPMTPNGCDCFGCCTMPNAGPGGQGSRNVWIGALDSNNNGTCTFADVADPVKCPTCEPVGNCFNPCDLCEVCIGAPPPPPTCNPDDQCPGNIQPCGLPDQADCPANAFCVSGCCQAAIP